MSRVKELENAMETVSKLSEVPFSTEGFAKDMIFNALLTDIAQSLAVIADVLTAWKGDDGLA